MSAPGLLVAGLSHQTAPVALREKLAFRAEELPRALGLLIHARGFEEAVVLSTCNRVELYAVGGPADGAGALRAFLADFHGVPEAEFAQALCAHHGAEAAQHLFEVAASLNSQILGETEILGQTRGAYRIAAETGAAGPVLRAVFERAFFLAKELRSEGGLSGVQASVSSAAVQLARKIFEDCTSARVLVVGSGKMSAGIVRVLKGEGVAEILVCSRTTERAEAFAKAAGARCAPLLQLSEHLLRSDIVLVSTSAPHYLLTPEHIAQAHEHRHGRALFIIDLSVPRNVDPLVNRHANTFLYDIDDLEAVASDGMRQRKKIAESWRPRLAEEARGVLNALSAPLAGNTARLLLAMAGELQRAELEALRRGGEMDPAAVERVERAMERFQSKLLHGALATLKEAARDGNGAQAAQWVARLFQLQAREDGAEAASKHTQPKKE